MSHVDQRKKSIARGWIKVQSKADMHVCVRPYYYSIFPEGLNLGQQSSDGGMRGSSPVPQLVLNPPIRSPEGHRRAKTDE